MIKRIRFFVLLFPLFLCSCYKSPDEDHLDVVPKTNNSAFIKELGGSSPPMQMPSMGGAQVN